MVVWGYVAFPASSARSERGALPSFAELTVASALIMRASVLSEAALDTILPRIRGPLAHLRTKRQIGADPWQVSSKIVRPTFPSAPLSSN